MRRIVCAAVKVTAPGQEPFVVCGVRHMDKIMGRAVQRMFGDHTCHYEQGFVDHYGTFVTRIEAWEIAKAANQIVLTGPGFEGPKLFSENLY